MPERVKRQLSRDEMALWEAWNRAADMVRVRVAADVAAETTLTGFDFAVLAGLVRSDGGRLGSAELAELAGVDRGSLPHHLRRMRERGLVSQKRSTDRAEVAVNDEGRLLLKYALPFRALAVRRHFLDPLDGLDLENFRLALELLGH
jgi:DNA-binding MarR family transcriptional regulator